MSFFALVIESQLPAEQCEPLCVLVPVQNFQLARIHWDEVFWQLFKLMLPAFNQCCCLSLDCFYPCHGKLQTHQLWADIKR